MAGINGGSAGLGLSIAKRWVDVMNGSIVYQSAPGRGTRAFLKIPVTVENHSAALEALPTTADATHRQLARSLCVLVVDDNIITQKILERYLTSIGCHVQCVCSGDEALKAFQVMICVTVSVCACDACALL